MFNEKNSVFGSAAHTLGNLATEKFIEDRIIPLVRDKSEPLCSNINCILSSAGIRIVSSILCK